MYIDIHTLQDLQTHEDGEGVTRLCLTDALEDPDLTTLGSSPALSKVQAISLDVSFERRAAFVQVLGSHHLRNVREVHLRSLDWGGYLVGWSEHALSPALDTLAEHSPSWDTFRCQGHLPDPEFDELGMILISDWLAQMQTLHLETESLTDEVVQDLANYDVLSRPTNLRLCSSILSDSVIDDLERTRWNPELKDVVLESPLITKKGWKTLSRLNALPECARERFKAKTKRGFKSDQDLFGEIRSLLRRGTSETLIDAAISQLQQLHERDPQRYVETTLPSLRDARDIPWPALYDVEFGGRGAILKMERTHRLLPFLGFNLYTADPAGSSACWEDLVHAPVAQHIKRIWSSDHGPTDQAAAAFAGSPYLQRLESLYVSADAVSAQAMRTLLHNADMPALQSFGVDFVAEAWPCVLDAPCFGQLHTLKLNNVDLEDADVERLLEANPERLERLSLASNEIKSPGFLQLMKTDRLPRLRDLDLMGHYTWSPESLLVACERAETLEHLRLAEASLQELEPEVALRVDALRERGVLTTESESWFF